MIAQLRGRLLEVDGDDAVIDVSGVGYLVRCGARTLQRPSDPGSDITLFIDHQFTAEGGPRLFGFLSREERRVFRILQSIQGVGPKAALAVLDVLPPGDLARAVAEEDRASVARANGVGPKLALRIVTELKDKVLGPAAPAAPAISPAGAASVGVEATLALMGLGVAEVQARRAVDQALGRLADPDLPALIRAALQEVAK